MVNRTAQVSTPNASRYLQQLCKHFGHKVPTESSPTDGKISLPFGICFLKATDQTLTLIVEGNDASIDRLEQVISDHLARFAFRENPSIAWQSAA